MLPLIPTDTELGLIRLGALQKGATGIVHDIQAGRGLVSRLSVLGFTPEARVTMVQNFGHGPVIVSIRDTRIALGRGEAAKVRIRRLNGQR
ncbi:MAG: FeoA family protein [Chloroflexi bacterium B3_Chlor]|nr:MAG: FeoA family protein [Chloroflexi bacterium B3_Chlor]